MATKSKWNREPWPLAIILFFVVVFIVNAIFIHLAQSSWNGVVTENHYEKGLAYNQVIEAQRRQEALGWRGRLIENQSTVVDGKRSLIFVLTDRSGQPVRQGLVTGRLQRPIRSDHDRSFLMNEIEPGRYQAKLAFPLPGAWDVKIEAKTADGPFRFNRRIQVAIPSGEE